METDGESIPLTFVSQTAYYVESRCIILVSLLARGVTKSDTFQIDSEATKWDCNGEKELD